jgi:DNA-binding response OmpR family regulator
MEKILIIDDDLDIAELESYLLKKEGFETVICNSGEEALDIIDKERYDLILMDIMMPGISGIELCAKIREKVDCSIIFVTAKANLVDKMVGFEVGADDYVTKPFENQELVSRVKAHLRKDKRNRKQSSSNIIKIGEIELNKESFEVKKNGKTIDLSTREFELLRYLMENAGIALSKEQIFETVWGSEYGDIGTVAVNIKSLRDKLHDDDKYIITIWGYGYKFLRANNE